MAFELPTAAAANENSLWLGQVRNAPFVPSHRIADLAFNMGGPRRGGATSSTRPATSTSSPPGAAQGELHDVTGGSPNTVVQYGTIFDGEIIGITAPAGKLGAGSV